MPNQTNLSTANESETLNPSEVCAAGFTLTERLTVPPHGSPLPSSEALDTYERTGLIMLSEWMRFFSSVSQFFPKGCSEMGTDRIILQVDNHMYPKG